MEDLKRYLHGCIDVGTKILFTFRSETHMVY